MLVALFCVNCNVSFLFGQLLEECPLSLRYEQVSTSTVKSLELKLPGSRLCTLGGENLIYVCILFSEFQHEEM